VSDRSIKKEIYLDLNPFEKRLAVVEDNRLVEYHIERNIDKGITGNIYKGKVARVLPGMEAAFLEAGLERTVFLHVADVMEKSRELDSQADDDGDEDEKKSEHGRQQHHHSHKIQDMIKEGEELLVQVEKEPIGTKGARVTSYVSIPGRYLVFMPSYGKIGISRRLDDEKERRRLRGIVARLRKPGHGFIIRTVAEGQGEDEIQGDMNFLVKLWETIARKSEREKAPALLYEELDLTLRSMRDILTPEVSRFVIDSDEEYARADAFAAEYMPEIRSKIERFKGDAPMFDVYGIDVELEKALCKTVWLPSGGHIVIDQMEALTAIDVNTGKFVGKRSSEDTIIRTNLEAVDEVVAQLRLRNIGGIIVIDFIDMVKPANREKVYRKLRDALKADKARTNILKISELGIVEMTRKRTRESLTQSVLEKCYYCEGDGLIKGKYTVLMEIYRELLRELPMKKKATVYANPVIAKLLTDKGGVVEDIERRTKKAVIVKPVDVFHREEYEIV